MRDASPRESRTPGLRASARGTLMPRRLEARALSSLPRVVSGGHSMARAVHELRRAPRKEWNGSFTPQLRVVGGQSYDVANLEFEMLPPVLQAATVSAAHAASSNVEGACSEGADLSSPSWIEMAARRQHEKWVVENRTWAESELLVAYPDLTNAIKDVYRKIVRHAVALYMEYAGVLLKTIPPEVIYQCNYKEDSRYSFTDVNGFARVLAEVGESLRDKGVLVADADLVELEVAALRDLVVDVLTGGRSAPAASEVDVGERKRRRPKGSKLSRKITAVAASLKRGSLIRPNVNTSDALTIAVPSPSSPSSLQPLLSFHIRDCQNSNARRQKETNARDSPKLAFPTDGIIPEAPPTITFAGTALHGAFESIDGVGREASPRPGARPGAPPGGARGRGASVNLQIRKATPTEYAYQGITGNVGLTKLSVLPAANLLADFRRIADLDSAAINAVAVRMMPDEERTRPEKRWLTIDMILNPSRYGPPSVAQGGRIARQNRRVARLRLAAWLVLEEQAEGSVEGSATGGGGGEGAALRRRSTARPMSERVQSARLAPQRRRSSISLEPLVGVNSAARRSMPLQRYSSRELMKDLQAESLAAVVEHSDEQNEWAVLTDEEDEEDVSRSVYRAITGNMSRAVLTMRVRAAFDEAERRSPRELPFSLGAAARERARRNSEQLELATAASASRKIREEFGKGNLSPAECEAIQLALERAMAPVAAPAVPPSAQLALHAEFEKGNISVAEFRAIEAAMARAAATDGADSGSPFRSPPGATSGPARRRREEVSSSPARPTHAPATATSTRIVMDPIDHHPGATAVATLPGSTAAARRALARMPEPSLVPRADDEGCERGTIHGIAFDSRAAQALGWYFRNGGQDEVHGPYPLVDLEAWVDAGYFTGDELCWRGIAGAAVAMRTALRESREAASVRASEGANELGSAVRPGAASADAATSGAATAAPDGWYCDDTTSPDPTTMHGPYTAGDLQSFLADGHISMHDEFRHGRDGTPFVLSDALCWYYDDEEGESHGAFFLEQLSEWLAHGYFDSALPVRRGEGGRVVTLAHALRLDGLGLH